MVHHHITLSSDGVAKICAMFCEPRNFRHADHQELSQDAALNTASTEADRPYLLRHCPLSFKNALPSLSALI